MGAKSVRQSGEEILEADWSDEVEWVSPHWEDPVLQSEKHCRQVADMIIVIVADYNVCQVWPRDPMLI